MRKLFLLLVFLHFFSVSIYADIEEYVKEPAEISKLEWVLYKIIVDLKGDTIFGEPFELNKLIYMKEKKKIFVELKGSDEGTTPVLATQDNLNRSIKTISDILLDRLPLFDHKKDLIVSYKIKITKQNRFQIIIYKEGEFKGNLP
jgi:hypothetical protein